MNPWDLKQCDVQGRLFELSARRGFPTAAFARAFMASDTARRLDSPYSHAQWAGEEYLLDEVAEAAGLAAGGAGEVFPAEVAYWTGYLYRCWHVLTGEPSARIHRQAPAELMRRSYLMLHTMDPAIAVEDLRELTAQRSSEKEATEFTTRAMRAALDEGW